MLNLDQLILKNLITNDDFSRKTLPFLVEEYFSGNELIVFKQIKGFIEKYNTKPTYDALQVEIDSLPNKSDEQIKQSLDLLSVFKNNADVVLLDWLLDNTEKFCQEKAIYNAMTKSIEIMNDEKQSKGIIPQLLSDALAISFDNNVGHDYLENSDLRFDSYHSNVNRIPFDLTMMNKVTDGGLQNKTLTIFLAPPNTGKSLMLCHCAGANLSLGKNVLYISMEMSENMISKRIDANLLNISLKDILSIPKSTYDKRMSNLKSKITGRLIVKEYPTTGASVLHFKALINELAIKKTFIPDVIYIDYLNICASYRFKPGISGTNSYAYIKAVGEELRGLAMELDVPVVSATQVNRSGSTDSDFGIDSIADSFGTSMTADDIFGMIETEELKKLGQIMIKQLKRRDGDKTADEKFILGIDKLKQRLFDVSVSAQSGLITSQGTITGNTTSSNMDKFRNFKI